MCCPAKPSLTGSLPSFTTLLLHSPMRTVQVSPALSAFQFASMLPEYPILHPLGKNIESFYYRKRAVACADGVAFTADSFNNSSIALSLIASASS